MIVAHESLRSKHKRTTLYADLHEEKSDSGIKLSRTPGGAPQRAIPHPTSIGLAGGHAHLLDQRYESGQSRPTLDAIRKLAVALSVSADMLLFGDQERGPDEELKLQFEAVTRLDPEEKKVIRSVIESILLRHEARRWSASSADTK